MTRDELVAIVATKMDNPNTTAKEILDTIREALQEPSDKMLYEADGMEQYGTGVRWQTMLAASPLGEQSE